MNGTFGKGFKSTRDNEERLATQSNLGSHTNCMIKITFVAHQTYIFMLTSHVLTSIRQKHTKHVFSIITVTSYIRKIVDDDADDGDGDCGNGSAAVNEIDINDDYNNVCSW